MAELDLVAESQQHHREVVKSKAAKDCKLEEDARSVYEEGNDSPTEFGGRLRKMEGMGNEEIGDDRGGRDAGRDSEVIGEVEMSGTETDAVVANADKC
ncbi:hypothetical protein P3S68_010737 [Capsicum galapagoense]